MFAKYVILLPSFGTSLNHNSQNIKYILSYLTRDNFTTTHIDFYFLHLLYLISLHPKYNLYHSLLSSFFFLLQLRFHSTSSIHSFVHSKIKVVTFMKCLFCVYKWHSKFMVMTVPFYMKKVKSIRHLFIVIYKKMSFFF